MSKVDKDTLIETYKAVLSEEQFFHNLFENRLSFYTGLLTTIVSAIVVGFFYSKEIAHYILLSFGPIIIIFVSITGVVAANRTTERISKILTVRAKIEQALGLTKPLEYKESPELYWASEPIVDLDHIAKRKAHQSSRDFSEHNRKSKGYWSSTNRFYYFFILVGIFLEGIIVFKIVIF